MENPWPIEIDGLPNLKMYGSFHGYVTNNQSRYFFWNPYFVIFFVGVVGDI